MNRAIPRRLLALGVGLALVAEPAHAGNKLIPAGKPVGVANSPLTVTPGREWNKLGVRPGRLAETWTIDGDTLNAVKFYGGIESGRPLFREVDRRNRPLPHFSTTMLPTDIVGLFESSYRVAFGTSLMVIDKTELATFAGKPGVRFDYHYSLMGEEVERRGEGRAAIVGGKLYMITFEAPALYYYETSHAAFDELIASAILPGG